MASGELNSQDGARICNGLGIMRACLETVALQRIEEKACQLEATPGRRAMANSAIDRLIRRIDAIAVRRCGRLSLDSLTDEAWLKIERLAGPALALAGRHQGPSIGPTTICFAFLSSRAS